MEHRWGTRIPLDMPVRLVSRSREDHEARLVDLSFSGALIATDGTPKLLSLVSILWGRKTLVEAFVTRLATDCVGIEWSEFKPPPIVNLLTALTEPGCTVLRWLDLSVHTGDRSKAPRTRFQRAG